MGRVTGKYMRVEDGMGKTKPIPTAPRPIPMPIMRQDQGIITFSMVIGQKGGGGCG